MRGELKALKNRTFVKDYLVNDVLFKGQDSIVYIVEDMKQGVKFLLTEFTPRVIVMRDEGEESLTILNKKRFGEIKQQFVDDSIRSYQTKNINLMKTLCTFEANETVYSVTEYHEEKPFQEYIVIVNKQFSEIDVLMLFMPLFSTLTSLHHKGEIFKHLSLSNLFVGKQGNLFLSQVANAYPSIYHHYSPIEQYRINEQELSVESDIYALAALMYEIIDGNPPIDARIRDKALQNGEEDPFKPLTQRNRRSKVFCDFVNQALSLVPENRPSSLSSLQTLVKTKPEVTQKESLNPLKAEKKESVSLFRMAGIMLLSVVAYSLIIEHSAATVSINEISKFDMMRYQWAAFWGDDKAQDVLGSLYEHGIQVEQNPKKAKEWYQKAADQGNMNAIDRLAQIKKGVKSTPSTTKKSTPAPHLSRKQYQELRNQRSLAYYYYASEKNYAKAFELYSNVLKQDKNDAYAMMTLGYFYRNGKGVKKDYNKANKWLQKATKKGDPYAPYYLGNAFNNGDGVKRDLQKAFSLYKLSAERGFDCAMVRLGTIYFKGVHHKDIVIKKDLEVARSWFLKASGKGNAVAKKYLEKIDRMRIFK